MSCPKGCVYPHLRCLNCGEVAEWSSETPTEPGWYWLRNKVDTVAVEVVRSELEAYDLCLVYPGNGAWNPLKFHKGLWLRIEVPE